MSTSQRREVPRGTRVVSYPAITRLHRTGRASAGVGPATIDVGSPFEGQSPRPRYLARLPAWPRRTLAALELSVGARADLGRRRTKRECTHGRRHDEAAARVGCPPPT